MSAEAILTPAPEQPTAQIPIVPAVATAPPAPAPAAPQSPAVPTPAPAPAATTVTIPLEQLQTFTTIQTRLAQLEAEQAQRDRAAQEEQARLMAKNGEIENALKLLRDQKEAEIQAERARQVETEGRAKRYAVTGEMSRALSRHSLVPGAADQLSVLWSGNLQAHAEGNSFAVRTPTYETADQFVASQLAKPEYSHFLVAKSAGGTALGNTSAAATTPTPAAQAPPAEGPKPVSFIDHVMAETKAKNDAHRASGDPRAVMGSTFGLRRA